MKIQLSEFYGGEVEGEVVPIDSTPTSITVYSKGDPIPWVGQAIETNEGLLILLPAVKREYLP